MKGTFPYKSVYGSHKNDDISFLHHRMSRHVLIENVEKQTTKVWDFNELTLKNILVFPGWKSSLQQNTFSKQLNARFKKLEVANRQT